ncbi:MAG: DNA-binding protein [Clostridiales bacterium 43-6]|nr:MAG: DNA-binding protein [Clostridiales bacterium 43-6]
MNYNEHIATAIEYIEENLKNDINIADCANIGGYSLYHFLRVFKDATGFTPADYIRKRRLSEISKEIIKGNEYISEVAFSYGFNSKENFLRAFKSEHHILPSEYKSAENSLKLYERFTFDVLPFCVTPKIITLEAFQLTVYKSDEDYTPKFWNKYNSKKMSLNLSNGKIVKDYGVCVWNINKQKLDYYIGIKTQDTNGNLSNTQKLTIKSGLYAVFATPVTTQSDFVNTIHKTWEYIYNVWLPSSAYNHATGYDFECYIEESRTFSEDIYIPIKRD